MSRERERMTNGANSFRVEYGEVYVPKGEEPTIYAPDLASITLHDVIEVGGELRYRYSVLWADSPESAEESDSRSSRQDA